MKFVLYNNWIIAVQLLSSWRLSSRTTGFQVPIFHLLTEHLVFKYGDADGIIRLWWSILNMLMHWLLKSLKHQQARHCFFLRQVLVAYHLEQLKPERPSVNRALPTSAERHVSEGGSDMEQVLVLCKVNANSLVTANIYIVCRMDLWCAFC